MQAESLHLNLPTIVGMIGGLGGSVTYALNRRWALRAVGDRVTASFSLRDNATGLANSSHMTTNTRGMIGVVYRF